MSLGQLLTVLFIVAAPDQGSDRDHVCFYHRLWPVDVIVVVAHICIDF